MGFFDRLEKAAKGLAKAGGAPLGLVKDFATAPFTDEKEFKNGIAAVVKRRGAQALEGTVQAGALPVAATKGFFKYSGLSSALEGVETAYREVVAEPLSTGFYLDKKFKEQGFGAYVRPENYREGYRRAQFTSPGQSYVTSRDEDEDLRTPEAVQKAFSDWDGDRVLSGTIDATARLLSDPTNFLIKGTRQVVVQKVAPRLDGAGDLDRVMGSKRLDRFVEQMDGLDAARIRDRFFPETPNGGALSVALAQAETAAARKDVMSLAMGDRTALKRLYDRQVSLGNRAEELLGQQSVLRGAVDPQGEFARINSPEALARVKEIAEATPPSARPAAIDLNDFDTPLGDDIAPVGDDIAALGDNAAPASPLDVFDEPELVRVKAELDEVFAEQDRLALMDQFAGTIQNGPGGALLDVSKARSALTHSRVYQSKLGAPLRATFDIRPPRMVDLNDPAGDISIQRQLKKSPLLADEQDAFRARYMAETTPEGRGSVLQQMEETILTRFGDEAGMDADEIAAAVSNFRLGKQQAQVVMRNRAYDAEGRASIFFKDPETGISHQVMYPLMVTQTANTMPLADLDEIRRAIRPIGQWTARHRSADLVRKGTVKVPAEMMTQFYKAWKPSVLFRVGWPVRVVGESQLRIMSQVGALSTLAPALLGTKNTALNMGSRAAARAKRVAGDKDAKPNLRIQGFDEREIRGYKVEGAFGDDTANPNVFFELSSSAKSNSKLFDTYSTDELTKLRKASAGWSSIKASEQPESYAKAWLNDVNQQMGRDDLARIFLKGGTVEDGVRWLRTPEGRAYASRLPKRRGYEERWAGSLKEQVDSYTMGDPAIMAAALKQQATVKQLEKIAPDPAARPPVHGELLADIMGKSPIADFVSTTTNKIYKWLGTIPEDVMARHPLMMRHYDAEVERLVNLMDDQAARTGEKLSFGELQRIQRRAREYATQQSQKLLYEFGEQSDMSNMLRFMVPFYTPFQDALVTWAGIAVKRPDYMLKLRQVWLSPEKAGLITDEEGNALSEGDAWKDEITYDDGTTGEIGRERYVTLPIPADLIPDVSVLKGLKSHNEVRFNKRSFNLVLQGTPGFGPPVQIPVNEIVKTRPDLEKSLKFMLPFGAQQNVSEMLLPATAKRYLTKRRGMEDREYFNVTMRLYTDSIVDLNLGLREPPEGRDSREVANNLLLEARRKADAFYSMRTVANFVLPAAPGFTSPYQPYIDSYRRMREKDPLNADQQFLDTFGPEYFAVTQSYSKSMDGVIPTVEAFKARGKYRDLIERYPEFGRVIIGDVEGNGDFSNSVYQSQIANKVSPGAVDNQRERLPFEDVRDGPGVRLGWIEYTRMNDLVEAERVERGLPNLRVKAAQDLQYIKTEKTKELAARYPEWFDKFNVTDRGALGKRLRALREISSDERLIKRPDIQGVAEYLEIRKVFRAALQQRESTTLDSTANVAFKNAWDDRRADLAERNPEFAKLYYRYLERDDLEAE